MQKFIQYYYIQKLIQFISTQLYILLDISAALTEHTRHRLSARDHDCRNAADTSE